ncbi:TonB-dependent siderophore receptor [Aquabacterium sp. OR-4]|uniref:TonB-dependent siderophore receptor n=1 Tax=Aquabacterium sp. OR-4 TaxID=2978127 RepID=UPI0021B18370|nr:TonB-dependent receptor [Aquabacterium sp. OR-4]MDT7835182.1 TonB-dependent receptor [Aquabacterium sp. OR-4]
MASIQSPHHRKRGALHPLALAAATLCALASGAGHAQEEPARITISGRASAAQAVGVSGFGDVPLWRLPISATVIRTDQLADAAITGLGDLTRLDAGATDAYNAPGYWNQLAVRGFTLDNRFNYRRDGLPINAETVIGLDNKQALELLKGASGLQAGTSAPGGLLNLTVKRPKVAQRSAMLGWQQDGTLGAAIDIGDRAGAQGELGWRINASASRLDPSTHNAQGHRWLWAAAGDLRLSGGTLIEAELELSRQSQPSTPGFSLLGDRLPSADSIDPRLNLNRQPWSLPVVMDGRIGSVRISQPLSADVQLVAHGMRQRLDSDDRIAFPFGCSAAEDYSRYCADGSFDLYDFRSENERRTSDAFDLSLQGRAATGSLQHQFNLGLLFTRYATRLGRQAYNWVGVGSIYQDEALDPDPSLTDDSTNRRERTVELHLQDSLTLSDTLTAWAGLRHSRLHRESRYTHPDDPRPTAYAQSLSTPWLGLSRQLGTGSSAYLSWGQGMESEVVPNRARYANAGQALPALKSRQLEAGYKSSSRSLDWRVAAFDIRRPVWSDLLAATGVPVDGCSSSAPCRRAADGAARHQGLEAEAEWRSGPWALRGSAMALHARREGSADSQANGKQPTNVPALSLKAQAAWQVPALPALALLGFITHEGRRQVLPKEQIATPGWTRIDLGARYSQRLGAGTSLVWRAGVDNLANRRAWKEAPFQYGHAYLYPLAPRTFHASAHLNF